MKKWFLEASFPGVRRCKKDSFRVEREIFKGKSRYQDIYIFESPGFGAMLALDGIIQFSESDEFIYHEVISHIPLFTHPAPRKLLVVGGGDGGVLRESLKHPLREAYFVEIDRKIVEVCRKYLPFVSRGSFDDPRVKIVFDDGKKFIKGYRDYFDVIVVDSTDPVGPGKVLFELDFYRMVYDALSSRGVAIFQLGPFLDFDLIIRATARKLKTLFSFVNPVRLPMPSYSCGSEYCFLLATKKTDPARIHPAALRERMRQRLAGKAASLKYYSPEIHAASLVMPKLWQI